MNMESLRNIVDQSLKDHTFYGAAILCGNTQGTLFALEKGFTTQECKFPFTRDTVIDIASCTKVCACITALLILHSRNLLDVDAPFTHYLPQYQGKLREVITVRDLANHTSGFHQGAPEPPRSRCYFDESGEKMRRNLLTMSPPSANSIEPHYSCWNYCLLVEIVETVSGMKFADFCQKEIFDVLGMDSSSLGGAAAGIPEMRLARTENSPGLGLISDSVAFRLYRDGFSSGNAGMFSSAADLEKLLRMYLLGGEYAPGKRLFSQESGRLFLPDHWQNIEDYRNFGWVIYSTTLEKENIGKTVFHHGYSGQTVAFDPARGLYVIVLTSRYSNYLQAKMDRMKMVNLLLREFHSA